MPIEDLISEADWCLEQYQWSYHCMQVLLLAYQLTGWQPFLEKYIQMKEQATYSYASTDFLYKSFFY